MGPVHLLAFVMFLMRSSMLIGSDDVLIFLRAKELDSKMMEGSGHA